MEALAVDEPGIRLALASYRRHSAGLLLAGLVLPGGFVAAASFVEGAAEDLDRTGIRVDGVVVETGPDTPVTSGTATVEYRLLDVVRRELVYLDDESPEYRIGDEVEVIIDRNQTYRATIAGETNLAVDRLADDRCPHDGQPGHGCWSDFTRARPSAGSGAPLRPVGEG